MRLYDVPAPAKLNLFLHVTGRRADGYHLLQTVFRFIDLSDTLCFERRGDGQIVCDNPVPGLSASDDLIVKAAQALQRATGTKWGAQISCTKRIPFGGGLGGGSSDAASTLLALNRLWDTRLTRHQLMALAVSLGADVPVFVFGQAAFAQGVGELLTAIELAPRAYLVVHPGVHVSTEQVFSDAGLTRNAKSIKIPLFTDWQQKQELASHIDGKSKGSSSCGLFGRNDLEPVVFTRYPSVKKVFSFLTERGLQARMTGSGGCIFAEFSDHAQALLAQQEIISKIPSSQGVEQFMDKTWVCSGLLDHPLRYWCND